MQKQKPFFTRTVQIGKVSVGGNNPVRIQSMTNTDTKDAEATALQIMQLADKGCEIARVTVQGKSEAASCERIKNILIQKRYDIPLVADIHFYPPAALMVADFVEKVRINPGNYADKRATFKLLEYTDEQYQKELTKIDERFSPLVLKCKKLNRAMRIGVNHGSLSDRIMNRFGDTPKGMVESAIEFARVCRKYDFHNFLFSMKSSNPFVMVEAYRLLVYTMQEMHWDYPLHLGVTEAGEGQEGRIKSSIGTGTLLLDGIGDTIRVSLTEDPVREIDPCQKLIEHTSETSFFYPIEKQNILKKSTIFPQTVVVLKVSQSDLLKEGFYEQIGIDEKHFQADILWIDDRLNSELAKDKIHFIKEKGVRIISQEPEFADFLINEDVYLLANEDVEKILLNKPKFVFYHYKNVEATYKLFKKLGKEKIDLIVHFDYPLCNEDTIIKASAEIGKLFCDYNVEGICISSPSDLSFLRILSFDILQGCRKRIVKTEFISCPSCGRTLFDLETVSRMIRKKTHHLPGVKIAIMGCIVNGPGEMADADFGFVGSKAGKVDLYVGKNCVEKNIDFSIASDKLVDLIKKEGMWVEPQSKVEV